MFTGIVEEIGTVRHFEPIASGSRVEIACALVMERLRVDDSISVAGVGLTVIERDDRGFASDIDPETLASSNLGRIARGSRVNLERAATPSTALGGHIVQGHVDATSRLIARDVAGDGGLRFALPKTVVRYVVRQGYVTLDGVSLTIARVGKTFFEVALTAHTKKTTLDALRVGDEVNVEVDVIARYLARIVARV